MLFLPGAMFGISAQHAMGHRAVAQSAPLVVPTGTARAQSLCVPGGVLDSVGLVGAASAAEATYANSFAFCDAYSCSVMTP